MVLLMAQVPLLGLIHIPDNLRMVILMEPASIPGKMVTGTMAVGKRDCMTGKARFISSDLTKRIVSLLECGIKEPIWGLNQNHMLYIQCPARSVKSAF